MQKLKISLVFFNGHINYLESIGILFKYITHTNTYSD